MNIVSASQRDDDLRSDPLRNRSVAILVSDGVDIAELSEIEKRLSVAGARCTIIAPRIGLLITDSGIGIRSDRELCDVRSLMFDAVYLPGGALSSETLCRSPDARHFVNETFRQGKTIGAHAEGCDLFEAARAGQSRHAEDEREPGVVLGRSADYPSFISAYLRALSTRRHRRRAVTVRPCGDARTSPLELFA